MPRRHASWSKYCLLGCLGLSLVGCWPRTLDKYLQNQTAQEVQPRSSAPSGKPRANRPRIQLVSDVTFRFQVSHERMWDALLDVLLTNYNLAIADRGNGLITTEWDSYYLEGKVHRNKLSIRLKRLPGMGVELTVFNNVERLSQASEGTIGEIWLPTDRNKTEVGRIVQNLAIALQIPTPELPRELMSHRAPEAASSGKM